MPFDSDVALLGTGVAPLVAANHFLSQGKSVILLNPDWDFFLENSELPLDPLIPVGTSVQIKKVLQTSKLSRSWPERALAELRPHFPGAVEYWPGSSGGGTATSTGTAASEGYHDLEAPHVRNRGRLWISSSNGGIYSWENLEDFYVEASDAGFNPQIFDGLLATQKFPGKKVETAGITESEFKGLYIPKLCDVDVSRYRNGLLEFVRERLGPDRVVCAASQIELMPEGVRFHAQGLPRTARLRDGMLVFWTPRLSNWVLTQAKKFEVAPKRPQGVRLWEEWSFVSTEKLDSNVIGVYGDTAVWADAEGVPDQSAAQKLNVLRAGPLAAIDSLTMLAAGLSWASAESFGALSSLFHGFLKWEKFSVRSMKPRAIFEWDDETPWFLKKDNCAVKVIAACDGPLFEVVKTVRSACEQLGGMP